MLVVGEELDFINHRCVCRGGGHKRDSSGVTMSLISPSDTYLGKEHLTKYTQDAANKYLLLGKHPQNLGEICSIKGLGCTFELSPANHDRGGERTWIKVSPYSPR